MTRRQLMTAATGLITIAARPSFALEVAEELEAGDRVLSRGERASLDALGEIVLPGASRAGIVRYVERQLKSEAPLLFLRYLDYTDDCISFYRDGLQALDTFSESQYGAVFPNLTGTKQTDLVSRLSQASPPGWNGPPSPLFYFVVRNDAVDVYYGTQKGFGKLDMPYLALIPPPRKW